MRPRTLPEPMRAYRIGDPAGQFPVWSTEGAKRTSGRWHEAGDAVIYASEHYSTALLEKLVHWNGALPPNQHFIEITIPAGTSYEVVTADIVPDWFCAERGCGPSLWPPVVRGQPQRHPARSLCGRADGTQCRHQHPTCGLQQPDGRAGDPGVVGPPPLSGLTFPSGPALNLLMNRFFLCWVAAVLLLPSPARAVEAAPALTDREIAERLTRLETRLDEGLQGLRADIQQLRADMNQQNQQLREDMNRQNQQLREDMDQLREDMNRQNQQLREDMNEQFARQFRLTVALLGAFTALVAAIIGFALWDRRTMLRPLERTVTGLTEDLSSNRQRLEALLDALRTLGQRNPEVAKVLKQFNLL